MDLLNVKTGFFFQQECIRSYSCTENFDALGQLFEAVLNDALHMEYLTTVLPFVAKLALQSPSLITQVIHLSRLPMFLEGYINYKIFYILTLGFCNTCIRRMPLVIFHFAVFYILGH